MTTRDYAAEYARRDRAALARTRLETPEQAERRGARQRRNWTAARRERWKTARRQRLTTTSTSITKE